MQGSTDGDKLYLIELSYTRILILLYFRFIFFFTYCCNKLVRI